MGHFQQPVRSHPDGDPDNTALPILPERDPAARDPFETAHRAMHGLRSRFLGSTNFPADPDDLAGQCGTFSLGAALFLMRWIESRGPSCADIQPYIIEIRQFMQQLGYKVDGRHTVLYVTNGGLLLPQPIAADVFFDSTMIQFQDSCYRTFSDRSERPLDTLAKLLPDEGENLVSQFRTLGYVLIPSNDEGMLRLGHILAAYSRKDAVPAASTIKPVDPAHFITSADNRSLDALAGTKLPVKDGQSLEWSGVDTLFRASGIYGIFAT